MALDKEYLKKAERNEIDSLKKKRERHLKTQESIQSYHLKVQGL